MSRIFFALFFCTFCYQVLSVHNLTTHLNAIGCLVGLLFFACSVLVTSRDYALGARSSARGKLRVQPKGQCTYLVKGANYSVLYLMMEIF